jgi:CheY-like chemotaxis protein/HPt (histidine-containing phosphotransfer) domain-containing protein
VTNSATIAAFSADRRAVSHLPDDVVLEQTVFNLRTTLDETAKMLAVKAQAKGLELNCHLPRLVPECLIGDPWRLQQIVAQLVANAVKFTERGEIVIRVAVDSRTVGDVCLRFFVSDTGIGMGPEDQARCLASCAPGEAPTAPPPCGTGCGLRVASRLANLMGGRLWVESELGRGSTFGFTARYPVAAEAAQRPGPDSARLAQLRGLPVLVVDDNATSREILAEFLTGWAMTPEPAADGSTALVKFQQATVLRRPFGLLIIDATLPDQDGFALVRRLRKSYRRIGPTILMLPAVASQAWTRNCRQFRSTVVLQKPIAQAGLLQAIDRALGRQAPPRSRSVRIASTSPRPAPGPVEVFDVDTALAGLDGRYDRLQKMVKFYFDDTPPLLAQMRAGLQRRDPTVIARAAHRLAGTLVYLTAPPALEAARRVDQLGVSGDLTQVAEAIAALEHELARLEQALAPHCAETPRSV